MIEPMSLAAVAAGADGLEIEVHVDPPTALSDKDQQLTPEAVRGRHEAHRRAARVHGRARDGRRREGAEPGPDAAKADPPRSPRAIPSRTRWTEAAWANMEITIRGQPEAGVAHRVRPPRRPRRRAIDPAKTVLVTDGLIRRVHGASFPPCPVVEVERGEAAKSLASLEALYGRFLDLGLGRDGLVLAIGGGARLRPRRLRGLDLAAGRRLRLRARPPSSRWSTPRSAARTAWTSAASRTSSAPSPSPAS